MSVELATLVVVPRERFGAVEQSLASLLDNTPPGFSLVYVDGHAPARVSAAVARMAAARNIAITVLRSDHYLTPNQARNQGLAHARTRYVVFCDNDVIYTPGWLEALIDCAEQTGADAVTPLTCEGLPLHSVIHQAGGHYARDVQAFHATPREARSRELIEHLPHHQEPLQAHHANLRRGPTGYGEFHCLLVRRSVFDRLGGLDEELRATKEHIDFAIALREAGGSIFFEPSAVVTFLIPNTQGVLGPSDWPYYLLRWSDLWQRASLDRLRDKWGLCENEYFQKRYRMLSWRREVLFRLWLRRIPVFGRSTLATRLAMAALRRVERPLNRWAAARHDRRHPPAAAPPAPC